MLPTAMPLLRWLRRPRLLLAGLGLLLAAGTAGAVQRALLVGVSELASQPASLWLQAPRNDVLLMQEALQQQGFAAADISIVADGVPGAPLPDARAIHEALSRLLAQSRSGDFVLLYFSGHGTRWRDSSKRYQEPDGLAENFLARDVRGTIGSAGPLAGGLRDVDFDAWVQAFLARNVFVWSVFDTCSAASMTRSARAPAPPANGAAGEPDDEVRWRGLRSDQLVPAAAPRAQPGADSALRLPVAEAVPRARYVAFFASESHQVTPELRLPRGDRRARPQGLLTWAVVQSLQRRPDTWRALFNGVLSQYPAVIEELEARFPERELPSPVAEGNLDLPLFANTLEPLSTRPQWPAQRAGASLTLEAGQLDGLESRQGVLVLAQMADGTQRQAAATLTQADLAGAQLPVPAALRELPGSVQWYVTPAAEPASAVLRVRAERPLPAGLNLSYPAAVQRVQGQEQADVRWLDAGRPTQRLVPSSPELLGAEPGNDALPDLEAVRRRLQLLAQLKWFSRLMALAPERRLPGFEAQLELWEGERLLRSEPLPLAAQWPGPGPGQRNVLMVRNASGHSVDLAIVALDAQGVLRAVYPEPQGETNRFERGSAQAPALKRFELPDAASGRLWVVASPAQPHSAPRLFGMASASALADLRVRGQARPERARPLFATAVRWGRAAP